MNSLVEPFIQSKSACAKSPVSSQSRREGQRPVLLKARGLRKTFGGQIVIDDVDVELQEGEVVLLRGENGSGKTTLLNILTGNLEADAGTIEYSADDSPRTYRFPRRWWQALNPWDHFRPEFVASKGMGRTWQDVRLFHTQTLRDNIAVATPEQPGENPLLALVTPGRVREKERDIRERTDSMLARFGLAGRETSSADKISLGQSKRVAIARAIAAGARILFLDEPLAGLDQQGTRNVLDLLESIVRDHSVTLVIVEHVFNLPQLAYLATSDWLLKAGKLQCSRTVAAPTQEIGARNTTLPMRARAGWFQLFADDGAEIVEEPLPRGATLIRIHPRNQLKRHSKPTLEIRNLIVHRGSRAVIGLDSDRELSGFSFVLGEGEIAVLEAPNGWGKSTLLETLAGFCPPSSGEMILNGRSITEAVPWRISRMGLKVVLSQNHFLPSLTLSEIASLAGTECVPKEFESDCTRIEGSLSGGEKQQYRLQLALSGKTDPAVLLLDEPFGGLDESSGAKIALNLKQASQKYPILIAQPSSH